MSVDNVGTLAHKNNNGAYFDFSTVTNVICVSKLVNLVMKFSHKDSETCKRWQSVRYVKQSRNTDKT